MILLDLARRAVVAAARELGKAVARKLLPADDDDELGQPLPYAAIEHQRAQQRAATSHKVKPPGPL